MINIVNRYPDDARENAKGKLPTQCPMGKSAKVQAG